MMRKLIFLLVLSGPCFAVTTRYVDTASTAGGNCTTTATVGANRACATLAAAVALIDKPVTDSWVINCAASTGVADTAAVSITGHTTTSSFTITINGNATTGVWSTSAYILSPSNTISIYTTDLYVNFQNLQIALTGTAAINHNAIDAEPASTSIINISNSIIRGDNNGTYYEVLIKALPGTGATVNIWNTLVYGIANLSNAVGISSATGATGTVNVYSSVVISGQTGLRRYAGTMVSKNVYAVGTGFNSYVGTITLTSCASSDTSGTPAGIRSVPYDTNHFVNVTPGSEDLHLVSVVGHTELLADSGTTGGVNTSADAAPLNFTTDLSGVSRQGGSYWDIGAFVFNAATARHKVVIAK